MTETPIIHLKCTRTGRLYRIVAVDDVTRTVTLKGRLGTFKEKWDPKALKEMGYERIIGPIEGGIEL